jgi:hypothetical protein
MFTTAGVNAHDYSVTNSKRMGASPLHVTAPRLSIASRVEELVDVSLLDMT